MESLVLSATISLKHIIYEKKTYGLLSLSVSELKLMRSFMKTFYSGLSVLYHTTFKCALLTLLHLFADTDKSTTIA